MAIIGQLKIILIKLDNSRSKMPKVKIIVNGKPYGTLTRSTQADIDRDIKTTLEWLLRYGYKESRIEFKPTGG